MSISTATAPSVSREPLDLYLREIRTDRLLTADEEIALAQAVQDGDQQAKARLIQCNLRLVVKVARAFLGRGLGLDDLIGEGNIGLITATEKFDPNRGVRFSTYACYWIRQAIREALIGTAPTIRLPAHMVGQLTKWRRAERHLTRQLGYSPTPEQVAESLALTASKRDLVDHALRARKLCPEGSSGDAPGWVSEEAVDSHETPDHSLEHAEDLRLLADRLELLDERERSILKLRYGLDGHEPLTLKEVGERLGFTREWVRKIELHALAKLNPSHPHNAPRPRRSRKAPASASYAYPARQAV